MMKKISAILAIVLVLTMNILSVSADYSIELYLEASEDVVASGETEAIELLFGYTPTTATVCAADFIIKYDPKLVSFNFGDRASDRKVQVSNSSRGEGLEFITISTENNWADYDGEVACLYFDTLEGANGMATFEIIECIAFSDYYDMNAKITGTFSKPVTVQVGDGGSSEPDPEPVFTVDKVVEGNDVKVTVANADKAPEGQIYVATFNGDVLVDCQVQDITNGTLTFSGLAGDLSTAKMFVWDELMIPITYATSAQ